MALDTADRCCLAYMFCVVAAIFLILATDPGDRMKKARAKVIARRQAMVKEAARDKAKKQAASYQRSIGTRGHGKNPAFLQRNLGAVCLSLVSAIVGLQQLQQSTLWPLFCSRVVAVGVVDACPALPWLDAMIFLSGDRGGQANLLTSIPKSWIFRDEASGLVIASDGTPTDEMTPLFVPSLMVPDPLSGARDDLYFVGFWVLAITAVRDFAFRGLFLPLAGVFHIKAGMDQHKFCECAWQVLWYTSAFSYGCSILMNSSFWFGALGGQHDWRDQIWAQVPQTLHSAPIKAYCT